MNIVAMFLVFFFFACAKDRVTQTTARRHTFQLASGKMKPGKKPSDYQSAVARHLAESKDCAVAYSDTSFRVVR